MSSNLILYDLPSRDPCKCWSLNPWKTRLLLNYKQIPYETQWTEYPDIKPLLEEHIPPNKEGAGYTIPAVKFPDGTYLQDSREIANRIEREHPDRPVNLDLRTLREVESIMPKIMLAIAPDFIPKIPKRLLNTASQPHWYKTREQRFGMPLDQVEQERGGDAAYMNAAPSIQEVTALLKANTAGPYFDGNQVTYVDFIWAGFLRFMQRIGDDLFDKVMEVSGDSEVHKAHLKACGPWLERDDH